MEQTIVRNIIIRLIQSGLGSKRSKKRQSSKLVRSRFKREQCK